MNRVVVTWGRGKFPNSNLSLPLHNSNNFYIILQFPPLSNSERSTNSQQPTLLHSPLPPCKKIKKIKKELYFQGVDVNAYTSFNYSLATFQPETPRLMCRALVMIFNTYKPFSHSLLFTFQGQRVFVSGKWPCTILYPVVR